MSAKIRSLSQISQALNSRSAADKLTLIASRRPLVDFAVRRDPTTQRFTPDRCVSGSQAMALLKKGVHLDGLRQHLRAVARSVIAAKLKTVEIPESTDRYRSEVINRPLGLVDQRVVNGALDESTVFHAPQWIAVAQARLEDFVFKTPTLSNTQLRRRLTGDGFFKLQESRLLYEAAQRLLLDKVPHTTRYGWAIGEKGDQSLIDYANLATLLATRIHDFSIAVIREVGKKPDPDHSKLNKQGYNLHTALKMYESSLNYGLEHLAAR